MAVWRVAVRPGPAISPPPVGGQPWVSTRANEPVHEGRDPRASVLADTRAQTLIGVQSVLRAAPAPVLLVVFNAARLPRAIGRERAAVRCELIGRILASPLDTGLARLVRPPGELGFVVPADRAACRHTSAHRQCQPDHHQANSKRNSRRHPDIPAPTTTPGQARAPVSRDPC